MKTKIQLRRSVRVAGDLREPRAGHHDAGGIDQAGVESPDGGGVHVVRHTDIIGVNDQDFGVARETEFFGERFVGMLCASDLKRSSCKEEEQGENSNGGHDFLTLHGWLSLILITRK